MLRSLASRSHRRLRSRHSTLSQPTMKATSAWTTVSIRQQLPFSTKTAAMSPVMPRSILPHPKPGRLKVENPEPRPSPPAAGTPFPEILTKFTSKLKKLSVTDLSSPSWCEQQFVYDLSKHGRKPPTEAMKAGTAVHEKLEQELQQTVTVELKLKEEEWALKLFNAIQALHALRYEGVTREVPVFGIHRNRVIMGIIDEIRMVSPTSVDSAKAEEGFSDVEDNAYPIPLDGSQPSPGVVQLTDHKTRQKNSVPNVTSSAAIPTKIQMMLYSHLLSSLPSLDIDAFCKILSLNPDKPFSDSFLVSLNAIAELSPFPTYSDSSLPQGETYTLETFLSHNSIRGFYSLLRREYPLTIASISPSLRICYRAAQTGHIISNKFIEYSPAFLHHSLESAFDFWEGKRDPVGVGVRDVWKCNFCEFIDTCEWRKKKVDEDIERARQIKAEEEKRRSSYSLEGVTIGEAMRAGGKAFDMKAAMLRETDRPVRVKKKRYEERDWWEGIPGAGPENDETEVVSEAKPVKEIEESVATLYSGVDAAVQTDEVPLPIFAPVATPKTRRRRRTKAEMMAARAAASSPVRGVEREVGVRAGTEEPEGLVVARKRGRPRTKVEEVKVPGRRRGRPRKEVEGA
ncbi:hypothetical protein BJ508DRAFT_145979 [Ascobolus immersus RN42]|uniref:Exonuclease V n=1 Tax=Ascobolus immersus RN42 TaxID=1160509 RepID=A0A3N4I4U7_ASCIM|nr:hypothetical protein BJ508DRAFT_145979 [Ascobolus immersus RN42]